MAIDDKFAVPSSWMPWAPRIGQRVRIRISEERKALRAAALNFAAEELEPAPDQRELALAEAKVALDADELD